MLGPAAVAVVLILIASGYLIFNGFYDREVASTVRQVSLPAVTGLASIQQERQLTIAYLAQRSRTNSALLKQRQTTDSHVDTLKTVAASALSLAPPQIVSGWQTLRGYLDRLPQIRSGVDSGTATSADVYTFYDNLLGAAATLFDEQARAVPDVTATQGALDGIQVFQATDAMSRAGSLITGAFGTRTFSKADYLQFVNLVGAYHARLTAVASALLPDIQKKNSTLTKSDSWKQLVAAENALIVAGPWHGAVPEGLPVTATSWETLTGTVSAALTAMTIGQADEVSARALTAGNTQLLTASIAALLAVLLAVGAILWAVRRSQLLVDSALVVQLRRLEDAANHALHHQLPARLEQIRSGKRVETKLSLLADGPGVDYEEVKNIGDVLNGIVGLADNVALQEAESRVAAGKMFVGIAYRQQQTSTSSIGLVRSRQRKIGNEDPEQLDYLLNLDHMLTQGQRESENLIILGGGQIGRRYRDPVPLDNVIQNAMAETQKYQRIRLKQAPRDQALVQHAVGAITHLLAELLENALRFSEDPMTVEVECSRVGNGYVVEISDRGLGMKPADFERYNKLLAEAPDPDLTQLNQAAQWGFWVVALLARRYPGVRVTLREGPWGGVQAIVIIPDDLIVPAARSVGAAGTGAHRLPAPAAAGVDGHSHRTIDAGQRSLGTPPWPDGLQQRGGAMGTQDSGNTDQTASQPSPTWDAPASSPPLSNLPELPDRVRGANLAAPLRGAADGDHPGIPAVGAPAPQLDADRQRTRYDSLQRGLNGRPRPYPTSDGTGDGTDAS